jgi:hypothetical protein
MSTTALSRARRLDSRIRELHRSKNRLKAEITSLILEMDENGLHRHLGYASVRAYASEVLSWSAGHTRDVLAMARRLTSLPRLREAFQSGELYWTRVRSAASVATPEDDALWLERARTLTARELERATHAARGLPLPVVWRLELSEEQAAILETAIREIQKERPGSRVSREEALAELCRRALTGGTAGNAQARIVYHVTGEEATIETAAGPVPVAQQTVERGLCNGVVLDLREPDAKPVRTVPTKVAREVLARTNGRCAVPGCPNLAWIEIHHEGGWRKTGHDPARMTTLCAAHHQDRHEGRLQIEILANGKHRFLLADGTEIERSRERYLAPGSVAEDAFKALVKLELRPAEARRVVLGAMEILGPGATAEELVKAALAPAG